MITSNTKYSFGGKVSTVETISFKCLMSTAKEGLFKKQSMIFSDLSGGLESPRQIARFLFNDHIDSPQRMEYHDVIAQLLDRDGMNGQSLRSSLLYLFERFKEEGIGQGTMI
jgi:hypothetical protein